jgi:hypothetical protein
VHPVPGPLSSASLNETKGSGIAFAASTDTGIMLMSVVSVAGTILTVDYLCATADPKASASFSACLHGISLFSTWQGWTGFQCVALYRSVTLCGSARDENRKAAAHNKAPSNQKQGNTPLLVFAVC